MGKISQYTRALKAKLSDLFVVASSDNGSLSTKAVTTEQIGDAIITEQTFSDLDGKTPAEAMADNTDNIGDLSQLTTTTKSSLVGAVNEVNGKLPRQIYKNLNWETVHSFVAEVNTLYLLTADSGNDFAIARIFSNGVTNLGVVSGSKITGLSYENGRLKVSTNNCGMVAIQIA